MQAKMKVSHRVSLYDYAPDSCFDNYFEDKTTLIFKNIIQFKTKTNKKCRKNYRMTIYKDK